MRYIHVPRISLRTLSRKKREKTKGMNTSVDLSSHELGLDLRKRFFGLGNEIIPLLFFG